MTIQSKHRWKQFRHGMWLIMPAALTFFGMVLFSVPFPLPGFHEAAPLVAVIAIFYWCCYAPNALPYWFIFLLGLAQDALHGTPIGFSATTYLLLAFIIITQRRFLTRENFTGVWIVFIAVSGLTAAFSWGVLSLYLGAELPTQPFGLQWLLTFLLYPALHGLFSIVYRLSPINSLHAH